MPRPRCIQKSVRHSSIGALHGVGTPRVRPRGAAISIIDRLLESATEHHRAGNLPEARRLYAQFLAANPTHDLALFRSGLLDLQDRRLDASLGSLQKAALAVPGNARYQFGLGQVLDALQRWDEAADAYRHALANDPASHEAHVALGMALQQGGRPAQAAAAYRAALALRAEDPVTLSNLGAALREAGMWMRRSASSSTPARLTRGQPRVP